MLARLIARDFRNIAHLDIALSATGLVIVGENGHGKTSLLEAVAYLSMLRSLRGARDADVVRFGANVFHVRGELAAGRFDSVGIGYERSSKKKRVSLDGVEQSRLTTALGAVPSVCFSPADVLLIAGGPSERRRYLDVTLALSSSAYLHALQQYRGSLSRRNAALRTAQREGARSGGVHDDLVSVWEPALARHGAAIATRRQSFVEQHMDQFSDLAESIGERQPVTMRYASSLRGALGSAAIGSAGNGEPAAEQEQECEARLRSAYTQQRALELRRGVTLVGPHRDELQLLLGGRELRTFGSAGQQRSAAIALRLLELSALRDAIGTTPLLLLDDPFAELDAGRAARVLRLLEATGVGQVLLAVPRVADIPAAFCHLERCRVIDGAIGPSGGST